MKTKLLKFSPSKVTCYTVLDLRLNIKLFIKFLGNLNESMLKRTSMRFTILTNLRKSTHGARQLMMNGMKP